MFQYRKDERQEEAGCAGRLLRIRAQKLRGGGRTGSILLPNTLFNSLMVKCKQAFIESKLYRLPTAVFGWE